jgi:ubiquinone/menaquinone biosynthesis C-methylase UbiE
MGSLYAEHTVGVAADWEAIAESGRADVARAIQEGGLRTGSNLDLVEIGCGVARLTSSLAPHYRAVRALDLSTHVISEARIRCPHPNVSFEVSSGRDILPGEAACCDVVFSAETFHHVQWATVQRYLADSFRILRKNGEVLLHVNVAPPRAVTRLMSLVRRLLHHCGVKMWRGWPTDPGFGRQFHRAEALLLAMRSAGFVDVERRGRSDRQAWFFGRKGPQ